MSGEALRLEIGQERLIRQRRYRIAARVQCSGSEGDWEEWLLALIEETPAAAVAAASGLWLEVDEGELTLWTPTLPPPEFTTASLGSLRHLVHQGRKFTVRERGSATVRAIEGDAGGDCVVGTAFNYIDLDGPMAQLGIEWDGAEVELFLGQRIDFTELQRWAAAAAGKPMPTPGQLARDRRSAVPRREPSPELHPVAAWAIIDRKSVV